MRGNAPTIRDIVLEPQELVLPVNLLADESLSLDDIPEEEPKTAYKVDSSCCTCSASVRLVVAATSQGIKNLERLLLGDVDIICARCVRNNSGRNGP